MNEGEVKKCPKCMGEMKSGNVTRDFRILKEGDLYGDKVYALYVGNAASLNYTKNRQQKSLGGGVRLHQNWNKLPQPKNHRNPKKKRLIGKPVRN